MVQTLPETGNFYGLIIWMKEISRNNERKRWQISWPFHTRAVQWWWRRQLSLELPDSSVFLFSFWRQSTRRKSSCKTNKVHQWDVPRALNLHRSLL